MIDQITEPILLHKTEPNEKAAEKRAVDLLGQVGIPANRARDYPHQLSGGQRQRVLIAMSLACDPDLLIADEPTTALDLMVQAQVLAVLEGLRAERQLSMIFITHDLSVLTYVCDSARGDVCRQGSWSGDRAIGSSKVPRTPTPAHWRRPFRRSATKARG